MVDHRLRRRRLRLVLEEIPDVVVLFLADLRHERDRLDRGVGDIADFVGRQLHPTRDLLGRGLAAHLLNEVAAGADELVDRLDHVHRDLDRAGLVVDGARDRLAIPPRRVRRALVQQRYSNFSTAFIKPIYTTWIRSRNWRRRLVYFLAMETTRRRLASTKQLALGVLGQALHLGEVAVGGRYQDRVHAARFGRLVDRVVGRHAVSDHALPLTVGRRAERFVRRLLDMAEQVVTRRGEAHGVVVEVKVGFATRVGIFGEHVKRRRHQLPVDVEVPEALRTP